MTDDFAEAKIAELMRERDKLQAAMMDVRSRLHALPWAGPSNSYGAEVMSCFNLLSRALGLKDSDALDDFVAQRRRAEQAAERD